MITPWGVRVKGPYVASSDARYVKFYILPITIIAHQIYHDMIIIMICVKDSGATND